jgi:PAS domain S-box-containing protein
MKHFSWQRMTLIERVRWLRYVLPPLLALVVVLYQLGVAQALERNYGHTVHYSVEIAFYSFTGPIVTLLTLIWVERRLAEKERLERQIQARNQQLASLTAVSADAILTFPFPSNVTSWNRGAERMFGYQASDIIGEPFGRLLAQADTLAGRLEKQGVVKEFETLAFTASGNSLSVELTQTRIGEAEEGSPVSLIIMRDVTTRREREAIREEERSRIARDLHDGVAQTLYFLALKADMAGQQLEPGLDSVAAELQEIGRTARQVIRDVRRTIFALRPLEWRDGSFTMALCDFVQGFAEQLGWQVAVDIDDHMALPARLEPSVFRLVQESLNNVAKHAEATHVWVTLRPGEGEQQLLLKVRDDGHGFDSSENGRGGLGLEQMEARAKSHGGRLQLESRPGKGTVLTAHLPLPGGAGG